MFKVDNRNARMCYKSGYWERTSALRLEELVRPMVLKTSSYSAACHVLDNLLPCLAIYLSAPGCNICANWIA